MIVIIVEILLGFAISQIANHNTVEMLSLFAVELLHPIFRKYHIEIVELHQHHIKSSLLFVTPCRALLDTTGVDLICKDDLELLFYLMTTLESHCERQ